MVEAFPLKAFSLIKLLTHENVTQRTLLPFYNKILVTYVYTKIFST